jgi:AcrR family transcriptional regulator
VTASPRVRARRLEPDARREQILDVAMRLFGERPYAAVSTTDIASEAGVARGLLNHYFGTKRDLYLEVVRAMVLRPTFDDEVATTGPLETRVDRSVSWFLDTIEAHGKTWVAVIGAEGVGTDPQIEAILAEADDQAARKVLATLGLAEDAAAAQRSRASAERRAAIRAYGGMVKAAVREWVRGGTLTRDQVHLLLTKALVTIVRDVLPHLPSGELRGIE